MRGVLVAAGVALAVSILLTPYVIRLFIKQGFGQEIREEGPQSHRGKRGTPDHGRRRDPRGGVGRLPRRRTSSGTSRSRRPACWC